MKCAAIQQSLIAALQVGPILTMTAPLHFNSHQLPPHVNFNLRKNSEKKSNGRFFSPTIVFFFRPFTVVKHLQIKMVESNRDCLHNTQ